GLPSRIEREPHKRNDKGESEQQASIHGLDGRWRIRVRQIELREGQHNQSAYCPDETNLPEPPWNKESSPPLPKRECQPSARRTRQQLVDFVKTILRLAHQSFELVLVLFD